MSTCSEGYTTRLQLPHWAERSDIYVHFHTRKSLGGDVTVMTLMQNLAGSALFLPQGGTHFQLVPLGSPQVYFMGKFSPLTIIKFLPPMPPSKSDPNYLPLKKLKT